MMNESTNKEFTIEELAILAALDDDLAHEPGIQHYLGHLDDPR
jgi:hypothetical protein